MTGHFAQEDAWLVREVTDLEKWSGTVVADGAQRVRPRMTRCGILTSVTSQAHRRVIKGVDELWRAVRMARWTLHMLPSDQQKARSSEGYGHGLGHRKAQYSGQGFSDLTWAHHGAWSFIFG